MERQHVTWGIAALMMIGLVGPAAAKGGPGYGWGNDKGPKAQVSVTITDDRAQYQTWYKAQTQRCREEIDPVTGERLADLVQLVTDIRRDRVELQNRDGDRQTIYLTERTRFHFEPMKGSGCDFSRRGSTYTGIRPGDMIIVQGFLRAGGFVASSVRVVDHAWGWDGEFDNGKDVCGFDGIRAFGEVRDVDPRRESIEVSANVGRRIVELARGGEVLADGRAIRLSTIRRGDRVVFYYDREATSTYNPRVEATRIVVLRANEAYPDGNRPHTCDPKGHDHPAERGNGLEGRVEGTSSGVFFNKITIRDGGRTVSVLAAKSLTALARNGNRLPITALHQGDVVRISYTEIDGVYFANSVTLR
jgi:hypothetical protein